MNNPIKAFVQAYKAYLKTFQDKKILKADLKCLLKTISLLQDKKILLDIIHVMLQPEHETAHWETPVLNKEVDPMNGLGLDLETGQMLGILEYFEKMPLNLLKTSLIKEIKTHIK